MREHLRAIAKTGGGSAASLVMGVVSMKVLAVILGPPGVALFSLLRQTQQTAVVMALINGQWAIIQGVASRSEEERGPFVSTVFWVVVVTTLIVAAVFLLGAGWIAQWLTGRTGAATPAMIRGLTLSIVCAVVYTFFMSVLNGYRIIGRAALIQAINFVTIAALTYSAALLVARGTPQALIWLLNAGAGVAALIGVLFAWRKGVLSISWPRLGAQESAFARAFLKMAGSVLISGFLGFWVPLEVRTLIVGAFGLNAAGVFDVAWTLSMSYVLIILTSFSSYYLPTLSKTTDRTERGELIGSVFRLATMLMLPLVVTVIVLKPLVIALFYSSQFMPSLQIMRWMLIGDYFKVVSWVFSFTMVAYADMRTFLWTEIAWAAMTVASAVVATKSLRSLELIGAAFMVLYILYFLYTWYYVRVRHGFAATRSLLLGLIPAVAILIAASAHTWNDAHVRWPLAIAYPALAVLSSMATLTAAERRAGWHRLRQFVGLYKREES